MSVAASNHNGASDGITSQHSETTLDRTAVHDRCGDKTLQILPAIKAFLCCMSPSLVAVKLVGFEAMWRSGQMRYNYASRGF